MTQTLVRQVVGLLLTLVTVVGLVLPQATPAYAADCWTFEGLDYWAGVVQQVLNDGKGRPAGAQVAFTTAWSKNPGDTLQVEGVSVDAVNGSLDHPVWASVWASNACVPVAPANYTPSPSGRNVSYVQTASQAATSSTKPQFTDISNIAVNTDLSECRYTEKVEGQAARSFIVLPGEIGYVFAEAIDGSVGGLVRQAYTEGKRYVALRNGVLMVCSTGLTLRPDVFDGFRVIEGDAVSPEDNLKLVQQSEEVQAAQTAAAGGDWITAQVNWVKAHMADARANQPQPQAAQPASQQAKVPCPTSARDVAWFILLGRAGGGSATVWMSDEADKLSKELAQLPTPDNNGWKFTASSTERARQLMAHDMWVVDVGGVRYSQPGTWSPKTTSGTIWFTQCAK